VVRAAAAVVVSMVRRRRRRAPGRTEVVRRMLRRSGFRDGVAHRTRRRHGIQRRDVVRPELRGCCMRGRGMPLTYGGGGGCEMCPFGGDDAIGCGMLIGGGRK
jgi:hypothetical protein